MDSRAPGDPWSQAQPSVGGDGDDEGPRGERGSAEQVSERTEQPAPHPAAGSFLGAAEEAPSAASLSGFSGERAGRRYTLEVVQAPSRARMCGFGDKDRRPLSPTLVARLRIVEIATGVELNATDVDTSLFVVTAELLDAATLAPRSLLVPRPGGPLDYGNRRYQTPLSATGVGGAGPSTSSSLTGFAPGTPSFGLPGGPAPAGPSSDVPSSFTRNLVGTNVSSAHVARNEHDELSIFFVLQDVSVRLEGDYRLRLVFTSLEVGGGVNQGVSSALAETITASFTCYSPRKFPGQVPPTALSRKLANQGIKIPIRSADKRPQAEAAGDKDNGEDDDDDS